ncbi:hypothetical protein [Myroides odoratus]|uniref:Uncharacterized protein n=1 Tax=Myroides odoratus TaxID=256 RepID=A0A378U3F0_MYROD|nr:hypothetical protein [Myroides odoratus]QQU03101.1 hypothetical protein I6I89_14980 [Myroides odoratus]STZ69656.1 Uncharacterised protein [Myroides odoratus]
MNKILIGVMFAFALVSCETEDAREEIRETSYKEFVDIVLEPNLNLEKTNMIIDKDIVRKLGDKMYKLSAGEIEYSADMGKYGGYRIIFEAL